MIASTAPGMAMFWSRRDGGGASVFMWKLMMSIGVFALWNGSFPVSISYAIMPSA